MRSVALNVVKVMQAAARQMMAREIMVFLPLKIAGDARRQATCAGAEEAPLPITATVALKVLSVAKAAAIARSPLRSMSCLPLVPGSIAAAHSD